MEIGNLVWNDENGNGIQDSGEQGIPGITVALYRYDPDAVEEYYTYEIASSSNAETATPSSAMEAAENTAQELTVTLTGVHMERGKWIPVEDAQGFRKKTTDELGEYTFTVPVADMDNPVEPYRYRVLVIQPEKEGGGFYEWSGLHQGSSKEADSDVVSTDTIADFSVQTLGAGRVGERITVKAAYDSAGFDEALKAPVGNVFGLWAGVAGAAVSEEFMIYDDPDKKDGEAIDFVKAIRDMSVDAGIIMVPDPEPEPEPEPPVPPTPEPPTPPAPKPPAPKPEHTDREREPHSKPEPVTVILITDNEPEVPFTLPKTGAEPYVLLACMGLCVSLAGLVLTRKRKKEDEK